MNFIKKYITLIIAAVITLIAIGLIPPEILKNNKLKKRMQESQSKAKTISSLQSKAVPVKQFEVVREYQDMHEQDANEISTLVKQTSQRLLLNYNIFPNPKVTSNQIFKEFGDSYVKAIDYLSNDVMRAGDAPSQKVLGSLTGSNVVSKRGTTRNSSKDSNKRIIDIACLEKAKQIPVYANPEVSFLGYDYWKEYEFKSQDSAIMDCWYGQVAYWIQKDVAEAISQINQGSESVLDSKVKRLLGISFESSQAWQSGQSVGKHEKPSYLMAEEEIGLAPTWTGRVTGEKYDIIHFSLAVIIEAKAVPEFYNVLCGKKTHSFKGWDGKKAEQNLVHNQISILQEESSSIHIESPDHQYYRYGNNAVVELNLVCEYLFDRSGYDEIKPDTVLQMLEQERMGQKKEAKNSSKSSKKKSSKRGSKKRNKRK